VSFDEPFDRILPDQAPSERADGWRYRLDREAGTGFFELSYQRVLPEKVDDLDAHNVLEHRGVILDEPTAEWVIAELTNLLEHMRTSDKKKREPDCKCHLEEGDSPCPVHGEVG
jgi:hypothetical protein